MSTLASRLESPQVIESIAKALYETNAVIGAKWESLPPNATARTAYIEEAKAAITALLAEVRMSKNQAYSMATAMPDGPPYYGNSVVPRDNDTSLGGTIVQKGTAMADRFDSPATIEAVAKAMHEATASSFGWKRGDWDYVDDEVQKHRLFVAQAAITAMLEQVRMTENQAMKFVDDCTVLDGPFHYPNSDKTGMKILRDLGMIEEEI